MFFQFRIGGTGNKPFQSGNQMNHKRFSVAIIATVFASCLAVDAGAQNKQGKGRSTTEMLMELKGEFKQKLDRLVLEQARVAEQILINTTQCESVYRQWYAADCAYQDAESRMRVFASGTWYADVEQAYMEAQSGQLTRLLDVMKARELASEISARQSRLAAQYYIMSDAIDEIYDNVCLIDNFFDMPGRDSPDNSGSWQVFRPCSRPLAHLRMVVVEKEEIGFGVAGSNPEPIPRETPFEIKACLLDVMTVEEWGMRVLENRTAPEAGFFDLLDPPGSRPEDIPRQVQP